MPDPLDPERPYPVIESSPDRRWRKKPVVIEAMQVTKALQYAAHDWDKLPIWLRDAYEQGGVVFAAGGIHVHTLEGVMIGERGDWIIQGVQGELYPCKHSIFEATYERVKDA